MTKLSIWAFLMMIIMGTSASLASAVQPQDWTGEWVMYESKAHPSKPVASLIIADRGDCAGAPGCSLWIRLAREGSAAVSGFVVTMDDANRHAVFDLSRSGGRPNGRVRYDAHLYVNKQVMSGTYKNVDARAVVPVGYFSAFKRRQ
jgi:hypothetical protein